MPCAGIVLVGFKLSLLDVASLTRVLPVVVSCIGAGIVTAKLLGRRLGVSEEMSSLIAAGTSICGVTAITSVSGAIRAKQQDVSFAVANVVAFGTLGMLAYPYAIPAIFHGSEQIGVFLGVAIHDTSQVMGSALTYSQCIATTLCSRSPPSPSFAQPFPSWRCALLFSHARKSESLRG